VIVDFLRTELAPEPYRGTRALRLASIVVLSLGVSLFADVASGLGAFLVVCCIAPDLSHTPRLFVRRAASVAAAMVVSVPLIGFLVELPWLALPVVFLVLALGGSLLPASRFPVEWMAVKFTVVSGLFAAQFAPDQIGTWSVTTFWSFVIPLATATIVASSIWPESARRLLGISLADTFGWIATSLRRSRDRLAEAADAPAQPAPPGLARHLGLIERLRREGAGRISLLYGISTFADGAAHDAARLDHSTSHAGRSREYLAVIRTELLLLLDDLVPAVEAYARWVQEQPDPSAHQEWPSFQEHLSRLDAQREALRSRDWYARLGLDEVARLDDALTAIRNLAERFRDTPDEFRDLVAQPGARNDGPPAAGRDPENARFSWRAATAGAIAYVVASASQHLALETTIWTTLHAAQMTHGATLRKMLLRVTGAVFGGALAIFMTLSVSANTDDLGIYLGSIFLVILPLYYVALGSPRLAYFGTQSTISFLLGYVSSAQVADVAEPLWRVTAIVFGDLILYATFLILGPDLASTRIGPWLRRLRAHLARLVPRPQELLASDLERQSAVQLSADLERITALADEARYEGGRHRIDVEAVLELVAVTRRILGRLQGVHELRRRLYRAEIPAHLLESVGHFESALDAGWDAAPEIPADPLADDAQADLDAARERLRDRLDRARSEIATLPDEERIGIYALYGEFDRLTDLLRRYRGALSRMRSDEGASPVGALRAAPS